MYYQKRIIYAPGAHHFLWAWNLDDSVVSNLHSATALQS